MERDTSTLDAVDKSMNRPICDKHKIPLVCFCPACRGEIKNQKRTLASRENLTAYRKAKAENPTIRQHNKCFNPWEGCSKFSEGCKNCVAYSCLQSHGRNPFVVRRCTSIWKLPLKWQRVAEQAGKFERVGCCFNSDFFHPDADNWRADVWKMIHDTPNLIWQIQTKRSQLMADRMPSDWGKGYLNVWLGVTVELKKYLTRLNDLKAIPAVVHYLDASPCLENLMPELENYIDDIEWVNVGGERGNGHRPFDSEWARDMRDLCLRKRIPFWYSHGGGRVNLGRFLDGRTYNGLPPLTSE